MSLNRTIENLLALSDDDPADIAATADEGTGEEASRDDHVHQGIASLRKAGDTVLHGAVTLTGGTNVTLTQSGQDVSIAAAAGVSSNAPQDVGGSAAAGSGTDASRDDHVHRGATSVAKSGSAAIHGAVTLTGGTNVTLTQNASDISIASSGSTTYKARWTKENDTNLLDGSGDYDGPKLEHNLTIASFLLEAVYDSAMTFKAQEYASGTETTRPGSLDDTALTFTDDAQSYDGDVGTYARATGSSSGMALANWPKAGDTQWGAPAQQALYSGAQVEVKIQTAGFTATKDEWRLRFSEDDGSSYADIVAWSSTNALDTYTKALGDPTGQTWDDMVVKLEVQTIGGPPSTVTLDVYDVRVVGTYAGWSDIATLTPGTANTGHSVTNDVRLTVNGDNGSKCQCVSLAFTS